MSARWAAIANYEGFYEVSDSGQVRSVDRIVPVGSGLRKVAGRTIRTVKGKDGRLRLALSREARHRTFLVHRLVAQAFVPGESADVEVCHNNGDCTDNRADNLRWDAHGENLRDAVAHGTHHQATRTHCPQDHPYDADNTYISPSNGQRCCRKCRAVRRREWAERQAA